MMTQNSNTVAKKLFDNLQSDLKSLSAEARKKHPPVKEAAEACMLKLRMISSKSSDLLSDLLSSSSEVVQPFIMGCDSKIPKMVHISLTSMQRMIQHQAISATTADNIINSLWVLMNSGVEELKLLQTAILMITTNSIVQHESLSRALVLGFRLYFTKDSTTINTAGATVRQLVNVVYDRVIMEDSVNSQEPLEAFSTEKMKTPSKIAPASLRPCARDGFLLFQDLCQLVNADNPLWLTGITEMTRTFGLELLESVMSGYPEIFLQHEEFGFLLKERVCPLVIKLFSPSLKFRQGLQSALSPVPVEKPYFPIVMRLLRIVQTLIKNFYSLLSTECEIYLSLLVKFMDVEKPMWQRCISLEVVIKLCSDPHLVRSFVETYDMKEHSAKIFYDMVSAIGSFILTLFMPAVSNHQTSRDSMKSLDTQGAPPALVAGLPVGSGVTPQPAFIYKNLWIPLIMNVPQSPIKPIMIDMVDKLDPPHVPDGYALTLGFACLLEICHSVELNILTSSDTAEMGDNQSHTLSGMTENKQLYKSLVESSWGGLLASLTLLLDASTDEQATEAILKAEQTYIHLAGMLDLTMTRDAFVTALCKSSLPPHYQIVVLNQSAGSSKPSSERGHVRVHSLDFKTPHNHHHDDVYDKSQVVAVGTALPTLSMSPNAVQAQVVLTAKNISCMRAILSLTQCHGGILGNSWNMVLTTLQHLVWILGLKTASSGQLKSEMSANEGSGAIITTAIMADLPVLSHMLSRLFESSQYLDDVAVHHLIDALCKLSLESLEIAYNNREPSLFAVAKILETGLVNLHRVEVLWKPLTAHLLEVCHHPHASMRCCGAEAITSLVSAALSYNFDPPLHENKRLQAMLLMPLRELSVISHTDVRQRQLECALLILQNGGETLGPGWPTILQVIGDGANTQGEVIIRTAFQSMQLVVTDFLALISPPCLSLCVETAAKFGLQQSELNISLTAIGLLWNISDFFYQQRQKISADIVKDADPSLTSSDQLWMCLYSKFGELCIDSRPAVRKSGGQTLFSTIAAHGDLLQNVTWKSLLWKVLFPLLDNVKNNLESAPSERERKGPEANILMHHSRDTAKKQWCETQVMVMAGVSRVFSIRKANLEELDDFSRAWAFLLQYIERSSMGPNPEVSLAALRSFQELVSDQVKEEGGYSAGPAVPEQTISRESGDSQLSSLSQTVWKTAWKVWLSIGNKKTTPPPNAVPSITDIPVPSQAFLCQLVQIFPKIFNHVQDHFVRDMFTDFSKVLSQTLAVPIAGDTSPFLVPTNYESSMSPVQETVIDAYNCLCQNISHINASEKLYPKLIYHLIKCSEFATKPPTFGTLDVKPPNSVKGLVTGYVASDMTEFSEKCMCLATDVYCKGCSLESIVQEETLKLIIQSLNVPLSAKYSCPSSSTWKLAVECLLKCVRSGLPVAKSKVHHHSNELWPTLSKALCDFLFSKSMAHEGQSLVEFKEDELLDCQVIEMISRDILPYSSALPKDFIASLVQLLNKGSIHSQSSNVPVTGKVRHVFTQKCFETLLRFSFVNDCDSASAPISQVAVHTLLTRCGGIITSYNKDVKLKQHVPSPSQVNEVVSAIQTAATLLTSLKRLPQNTVDANIWKEIIDLYPRLVSCIHSKSDLVLGELEAALTAYSDLLIAPASSLANGAT